MLHVGVRLGGLALAFAAWAAASDDLVSLSKQAELALQNGDSSSAVRQFARLVSVAPANEFAQSGLIRSLLKTNHLKRAREAAEHAQRMLPASASVAAAAGDVFFRLGDFEAAETLYLQAIAADQRLARAYLGLARVQATDFRSNSARVSAATAFRLDSTDAEILLEHALYAEPAQKIALYETYLGVQTVEPKDSVDWVRRQLATAARLGARPACMLQGPTRTAEIPLSHAFDYLRREAGFQLRASVNSRKLNLYLDSAVDGLIISRQFANKLRLQPIASIAVSGIGDDGARNAGIAVADSVQIAGLEFRDCPVKIVDKKLIGHDGLISSNLFAPFLITLDFPHHRIRLNPLPPVGGCQCDDPRRWSELDRSPIPQLRKFAPWRRLGSLPLVRTVLNGRRTGWFVLDTGSQSSILAEDFARPATALVQAPTTLAGVSGKVRRSFLVRHVELLFAGFRRKVAELYAVDLTLTKNRIGVEVSGLIGSSAISEVVVTIDYRDGLIDFSGGED